MKIGIMAFGSDGEIEPNIALAVALAKHNHLVEVVVISIRNRDYSALNQLDGISINQLPFPTSAMKEMFENSEFWNFNELEKANYFNNQFKLIRNQYKRHANKLVQNKDLIIGNRQSYPLRFSAEVYKIPYITLSFEYVFIKSKFYAPLGSQVGSEKENIHSWEVGQTFANAVYLPELNDYRKLYNLAPVKDHYHEILFSDKLNLVSFSKHFFQQELDWDSIHQPCGYFNVEEKLEDLNPDKDLNQFIQTGSKPVFITLGSLVEYENDITAFHETIIAAIKKAKTRAIIHSNWQNYVKPDEDVYQLSGFVKHSKIFPNCSLVVHHGGTGTMHTVAGEGIPSLILAYGFDQFSNAQLLVNAGICKHVIARKELTIEALAEALADSIADVTMSAKAKEIGIKIKAEDGLSEAVRLIEEKYLKIITE